MTHETSRRRFLRASVAGSALFGAPASRLLGQESRSSQENTGPARNIIFLVSDGMNHGALSLAQHFHSRTHGEPTRWMRLYQERPAARALVETFSANSLVTDSAAASSAWGSGRRVDNGTINVTPDGTRLTPLIPKLKAAGKRCGLVTTATVTHATPAGFAACVDNRGSEEVIAAQYLEQRVDVLLGGGQQFFSPELLASYGAAGYDVADSGPALAAYAGPADRPLLGLFSRSHVPYAIDRAADNSAIPDLPSLTRCALQRLGRNADGFFLLVEGARIDHAGHANDAAASIHEQLEFDAAIAAALEFADARGDTLVIITTDHGCGGIQMNGVSGIPGQAMAPGIYGASNSAFERVSGFRRSVEWMKQQGGDGLSGPALRAFLREHTGLDLAKEELERAKGLKLEASRVFFEHTGIGWTSGNHTGELVEFCASGPGAEVFPSFLRNFEIHDLLQRALGLA